MTALRDRKKVRPTAHRINLAAADTTADISSVSANPAVNRSVVLEDQIHVAAILEFSAANATANIALALWGHSGSFLGITEVQTVIADSTWRNGAAGPFVAPAVIFDTLGARTVKAIVKSLSGGNITNLLLVPLSID